LVAVADWRVRVGQLAHSVELFPVDDAESVLDRLRAGQINGAAVLTV
jgi:D-arabinose 1-dehydrogenase-like Zn-dependent alcohol dehydrogenase